MCFSLIVHTVEEETERIRREKGDAAADAYRKEFAIGMTKMLVAPVVGGLTGGPIGAVKGLIWAVKG